MAQKKIHTGWRWKEVEDLTPWQIPDTYALKAIYETGINIKNARAYDLGCGIGRHTVLMAKQGFEVYASDISSDAIQMTKTWLENENLKANLQQNHYLQASYPKNFFDLVISINTLNHGVKSEVYDIMNHIHSMLKPNGVFVGTLRIKDPETTFYSDKIEMIDKQTMTFKEGEERGIPHYYAYIEELPLIFEKYKLDDDSFILESIYKLPFTSENLKTQLPLENLRFKVKK